VILDNFLQQDELLESKKTLYNYEIYYYCQNQSFNLSGFKTHKINNLLTNVLNEISDYIEAHHLKGNEYMTYVNKKLDAIHCSYLKE